MIRLFKIAIPASVVGLIFSEAVLAFLCYIAAYVLVTGGNLEMYYLYEGGIERTAVVVASILLGVYFNDLYTELRVLSRLRLGQQYCLVIGLAFLTQALLSYVSQELILGRWQMIVGSTLALISLPAWRVLYDHLVIRLLYRQRVLFLGDSPEVRKISQKFIELPQLSMQSVGYLSAAPAEPASIELGSWLGPPADVKQVYESAKPDLIVVGLAERRGQMPVNDLLELRLAGALIEDASTVYERVIWRVSVQLLRPSQLIYSQDLGPNRRSVAFQSVYSFLVALIGVIVTLPIMAITALLVKFTSPGPVIYRQKRVGKDGRIIEVLKFRSMSQDAEVGRGAVWAIENDPRVTPVGRWLRKLRIDELPQFLNVLRGDMSIVGPRPERPEFVKVLTERIPFYGYRHAIKPGITGWAQISHRYGDTIEDTITKLEYDLYYLKHVSPSFDFYIMFHTLKVMILQRGAQ